MQNKNKQTKTQKNVLIKQNPQKKDMKMQITETKEADIKKWKSKSPKMQTERAEKGKQKKRKCLPELILKRINPPLGHLQKKPEEKNNVKAPNSGAFFMI